MSDPPAQPGSAQPDDLSGSVPGGTSDEMLLLGARLRDEHALAILYDRYAELAFTLALRVVGDRDLAEEVTRDVFLRCWHGLEQYDAASGALPVWLLGITRARAIEVRRGRQRQDRPVEPALSLEPGAIEPGTAVEADQEDLHATVRQALAELAAPEREAIEQAYYGGLTQAEVASQLGETLPTIKTRIRDGLRRLRRVLAPVVDAGVAREGGTA